MSRSAEDLLNLLNFLFWYEKENPGAYWGGVRIVDAIESARKLLGYDEFTFERLEQVVLGEIKPEDVTRPSQPAAQTSPEPPQTPG